MIDWYCMVVSCRGLKTACIVVLHCIYCNLSSPSAMFFCHIYALVDSIISLAYCLCWCLRATFVSCVLSCFDVGLAPMYVQCLYGLLVDFADGGYLIYGYLLHGLFMLI